jgi:hypothetical protein
MAPGLTQPVTDEEIAELDRALTALHRQAIQGGWTKRKRDDRPLAARDEVTVEVDAGQPEVGGAWGED